MRTRLALALALVVVCASTLVFAWAYTGSESLTISGVLNGSRLTASKIHPAGLPQAYFGSCQNDPLFSSASIRWTTDPTLWLFAASTTAGNVLQSGQTVNLTGTDQLDNFRAVITGNTNVTLTCSYWSQQ